jgi:ABC-type transport system involved in multi-copper enzyme maturation permease subunit
MGAAGELFKSKDLPERLGPMTVKELRQGLRRGMFVYPFLGIHLLAVVAMAVEFQMAEVEEFTEYAGIMNLFLFIPGHPWFSGPFWGVAGAVCLVLMPLGGLALMGQELEEGNHELLLMTPLSRWKVVRGKFLALWGLCLLTFVSLLPYMIVRYLNGGMDTWRNIAMAITVVLFSATMAAGAIGASSFTGIAGRIATLCLFTGSMLACLATVGMASGGITEVAGVIYSLNVLTVVFCYLIFGLALARSRIRLVVHHYEVKPSWMIIGLLFFTPFVVGMATMMTVGFAGGVGLLGMGLVGWFADVSPKAPKWVQAPAPNIPLPAQPYTGAPPPPLPRVGVVTEAPPVQVGEVPPVAGISHGLERPENDE